MRLVCVECGEPIPANHINVQDFVAICPACDTVFRFEPDSDKPKHRKIKAPDSIHSYDDAPLHIAYERIFGEGARASLAGFTFVLMMFFLLVITSTGGYIAGDIPLILPVMIASGWSFGLYTLAMAYFTRTRILYDGHLLRISRHWLPHPLQEKDVNIPIGVIERVYIEETHSSKRRGYTTRTFHIYAETYNGERVLILKDIPEQYALYIQQEIQKQMLSLDNELASRLDDSAMISDNLIYQDDMPLSQQAHSH